MNEYHIRGGNPLSGIVKINGAKNAVLPILAATILNGGESVIHNCPMILDVYTEIEILKSLGCTVLLDNHTLIVNSKNASNYLISEKFAREMRSSIVFLAPVLARFKKVKIGQPGGCNLGARPINLHINSIKKLGANIKDEDGGFIIGSADKLIGTQIDLDLPSVGATENIMLAAVLAEGCTVITNAAKEPEIVDLQNFLNKMGANVSGAGSDTIYIEGVTKLHNVEYSVMSDRIEAGTFLVAAAITGGDVCLESVEPQHLQVVTSKLIETGCKIITGENIMRIKAPKKLLHVDIRTNPHPGFPTDMQPQFMSLLTLAKGTSIIIETVFDSRFKHVAELNRMAAKITQDSRTAVITGVKSLHPATVVSHDLRGGAALILAALATDGNSTVIDDRHIQRGYENIEAKLQDIGANIKFNDDNFRGCTL